MGEPDLSCRRPGLALLRCAQPAVHPLPPRSTGDTRDDVVDCGDGVAARMGMVCHRRRTAQAPSQPIIVRRALLECQTTVDAFATLDVLVSNAGICPFHTFLD